MSLVPRFVVLRVLCIPFTLLYVAQILTVLLLQAIMLLVFVLRVVLTTALLLFPLKETMFPPSNRQVMELLALRPLLYPSNVRCILVMAWPWPLDRYLTTTVALLGLQFLQTTALTPVLLLLFILCVTVWPSALWATPPDSVPLTVVCRCGPVLGLLLFSPVVAISL